MLKLKEDVQLETWKDVKNTEELIAVLNSTIIHTCMHKNTHTVMQSAKLSSAGS